ncbi:hypothetical protein GGH92_001405 [Coemansia sp. RSA 2673]|nr:hypothetical protein GGH92_001405 [Coemansia sp. RSA 2673]
MIDNNNTLSNYHRQVRAVAICRILSSPSSLLAASVAAGETTSETRQRLFQQLAQATFMTKPIIESHVVT